VAGVEDVTAAERTLDEVDRALERLDNGTYGRCEVCGETIDEARLEADPTARTCTRHLPL
jgi:RNA polymerase-binding transcription factor DksA